MGEKWYPGRFLNQITKRQVWGSRSPQRSRFEVTFEGGDADHILETDLLFVSLSDIAKRFGATFHVKKVE